MHGGQAPARGGDGQLPVQPAGDPRVLTPDTHYCSHTIHLVSLMVDQDFEEAVKLILILERIEMTITTKVDNNIINTETCYICHRNVIEY